MPRVYMCEVCAKRITDAVGDEYVVSTEKHDDAPEQRAHVECAEKVARERLKTS